MDTEYKRDLNWTLYIADNNEVGCITSKAMQAWGEKGQYTREDIQELMRIKSETPQPDFSQRKPFDDLERQDRLIEYGKLIRSKLHDQQGV